jgi:hypothetical protein
MPDLPTPICVKQLCASLRALRDQVPEDAAIAIDSALADVSDDALLLVFTELSASAALIFRADGAYQVPAEDHRQASAKGARPPRWLVYSAHPEPQVQAYALPDSADVGPLVAHALPGDLTPTLTRFHFFRSLEALLPQIATYDADLTAKLQQLQTLRGGFAEELDGVELNLVSAVEIELAEDGAVSVELVFDWDDLPPEAQALPAGHIQIPNGRTLVLLGRDLELAPLTLLWLTRIA